MKKTKKMFLLWLFLVTAWNFGAPGAAPIYDILVAVVLSLFVKVIEKHV